MVENINTEISEAILGLDAQEQVFLDQNLIDLDGTVIPSGLAYHAKNETPDFVWYGQHNLEYFGDSEYYMFDNAFHLETNDFLHKSSRDADALLLAAAEVFDAGQCFIDQTHALQG